MKKIEGIEVLKEILKIGKGIFDTEKKLEETKIFGDDFSYFNFPFDIGEIVKKIIQCPEETETICNDWVDEVIFEYYENKLTLDGLIKTLLEE